jgi:hypothetical protein
MSGGLAFEGLNNASATSNNLLIILNDNDMAIDRSVGGMKQYLFNLTTSNRYNQLRFKLSRMLFKLGINTWTSEVTHRLADPRYKHRKVTIHLRQLHDRTELTISDEGNGFDWEKYEEISEERMFDFHGRGIPLARNLCFDQCQYNGKGNSVTCVGIHSHRSF